MLETGAFGREQPADECGTVAVAEESLGSDHWQSVEFRRNLRCAPRPECSESSPASTGRAAASHDPDFPVAARALPVGMHLTVRLDGDVRCALPVPSGCQWFCCSPAPRTRPMRVFRVALSEDPGGVALHETLGTGLSDPYCIF